MNFDNLKQKMDAESMDNNQIPAHIKDLKTSNMPIQKVRKRMIIEIITQLVCIILFFIFPSFIKMNPLAKGVYYITMFVMSLFTLGYLAKMIWFLNKTSHLTGGSKETVLGYIYDLKLTLEVYKIAIIAASRILPFPMIALGLGHATKHETLFNKLISLDLAPAQILNFAVGYVAFALITYFVTVYWSNSLYGKPIKQLENTLQEFAVED